MAVIFLNAGHGGKDSGAVGNGFKEKDLNLAIALECEKELKRHGVTVVMARSTDKLLTSGEIIKLEKNSKADLAVDIHNNAGGGDGAEAFYHFKGGKGKTLAENILEEIKKIGQNSRGAKTRRNSQGLDYYYFIRQTKAPAVIVECAFVDNKTDIAIIDTAAEQKKMGIAIAKGILKTLNIAYKAEQNVNKPVENVNKPVEQSPAKKTNEQIAKEVIAGKWGNGAERKKKLTAAGYDYAAIQKIVNKLLK